MLSWGRVGREGREGAALKCYPGNVTFTVSTNLSVGFYWAEEPAGDRVLAFGTLSGFPLLLSKINTPPKTPQPAPVSFDLKAPLNDVFN